MRLSSLNRKIKSGGKVVCDAVIEGFGWRVGGETQDLAARVSSEACGAVDEEEAQRLHAGDSVTIGALARDVEGKFALEFGEGLFLRAAAGGEGPQGLRG